MYNYAYLIGAIVIFPVWLIIFLKRKGLRKEMLAVGIYTALLAVIFEFVWFLKDYWYPLKYISIFTFIWQEVLFGLFLGGIMAVAYEVLFNKKMKIEAFNAKKFVLLLSVLVFMQVVFTNIFKINSIYANIIGFLAGLGIILYVRRDLFLNAIVSGIGSFLIAFVGYFVLLIIYPDLIRDWWMIHNISGIFIWKIPIEEIIWFTSFGLGAGPLYKFWHTS